MRFYVTAPVPGGYAWWDVRDRVGLFDNPRYAQFPVASFFRDQPNAEQEARELAARLNANA